MSNSTNETDCEDKWDGILGPIVPYIMLISLLVLLAESCITIIINRTKKLQGKASTTLVTSIAVSELLTAVSWGTFLVLYISHLDHCTDKLTSEVLLNTLFILPRTFYFVSIFNLCSFTLDRYIAICWPLHYHIILTPFRVRALTIVSWCIPGLINILIPIIRQLDIKGCESMPIVTGLVLFWPPTLAILVMYCLLAKEFRGKTTGTTDMMKEDDRVRYRTARDVFVVVMINIVLSLPYVSSSAVQYTCPSKSYSLYCFCHPICQCIKSHMNFTW